METHTQTQKSLREKKTGGKKLKTDLRIQSKCRRLNTIIEFQKKSHENAHK